MDWRLTRPASLRVRPRRPGAPGRRYRSLPASGCHELALGDGVDLDATHRLTQSATGVRHDSCILKMCRGLDNGARSFSWIVALEHPRTHENAVRAELHHEGRICGRSD